ncbi:SRPBCC family protein [Paenibacillus aceris]|uniref:Uncharacterized protein YndB with AHSA1/START domain n=1 Tax=Paenibacillus aceris TaxID=869555 RepID=A0ABS4HUC8_9BACL|nr:SRPBCC family protein [Paenibacillus aceris]MBP1962236.1 uncharacterized protein YndB with AHSA1/START domain [Paenibacillus aceris]NHW37064.1 hypothetical protein [Paenibacillus aceris]
MNNITKFSIARPAGDVFEALVDPTQMSNYWFSSGSGRWEPGKRITLKYEEYHAEVDINVLEVEANKKIVFQWPGEKGHVVTMSLEAADASTTIIEVIEEGFDADDKDLIPLLIDNKEGWVYMLTCLKAYLEFGVTKLRAGIVK